MSILNEAILINYKHQRQYTNIGLNAVGPTSSMTLRTVTAHTNSNCKYVRKFGTPYLISDVTGITDPASANMTFKVYALDGTLMGSRRGGFAFVDGAALGSPQGCYLEVVASGGAVTVLATITLNTDVGNKSFVCASETVADGITLRLYLSDTTSTYYDSNYMYGGARHTPTGVLTLPYSKIEDAVAVLGGAFTIVTVLDSATYDTELNLNIGGMTLQAALGQTPKITRGIGARASREVRHDGNNIDTIYIGKTGNDSTGNGKFQNPYLTIGKANTMIGAPKNYMNIIDSETYISNWSSLMGETHLEPIYGKMPTVYKLNLYCDSWLYCYGIIVRGDLTNTPFTIASGLYHDISDCTIRSNMYGVYWNNGTDNAGTIFSRNVCYNNIYGAFHVFSFNVSCSLTAQNNNIRDCGWGIHLQTGNTNTMTLNISDNLIYAMTYPVANFGVPLQERGNGITLLSYGNTPVYSGIIKNNTIYGCVGAGIYIYSNGSIPFTVSANIRDNILMRNLYGIYSVITKTVTYNNFYLNGTKYNSLVTSTNELLTDPQLSDPVDLKKFGIGSDSPCFRSGTAGIDRGTNRRIIEINESNININGFYIDGQERINSDVFILDNVNHTGTIIKWCDIYNCQGIAIDLYDNDTPLNSIISNCKIHSNGDGLRLPFGGNSASYCEIYNNVKNGIWNNADIIITNSIFYANNIGLNSNPSGVGIIKNSVFSQNFLYGIFSAVTSYLVTYCDITDDMSVVDITDPSNINVNPMFISLAEGLENFDIQITERGYLIESGLKDAGDDGYDIGCYKIDRSVANDTWRAHELIFNPRDIDFQSSAIGLIKFENGIGGLDNFEKDNKLSFAFKWNGRQYSDVTDRKKIQYLNGLLKRRAVETPDSETIIRLTFLKTQNLHNGTGTIDATLKTITDNSADLIEEEWRGFFVGVKFFAGTATGTIDKTAKTLTVSGAPGWGVNSKVGHYFRYGKYWYYILSNTADVLTLSDPDGNLVDASNIDWSIEKYFKCLDCYKKVLTVEDENNELIAGSYSYYIGFIEARVEKPGMKFSQPRYFWQQENWKTGYSIEFQEV